MSKFKKSCTDPAINAGQCICLDICGSFMDSEHEGSLAELRGILNKTTLMVSLNLRIYNLLQVVHFPVNFKNLVQKCASIVDIFTYFGLRNTPSCEESTVRFLYYYVYLE